MAGGQAAAHGRHFFPAVRYSPLPRMRLTEQALELDPAIIVFTGGAGAGKSLAARNLAEKLVAEGDDCVWIRLGPRDGGAERTWSRIFEALQAAGLVPEASLAARMLSGGLSTVTPALLAEAFAGVLTVHPGFCTLVLDDLHHVSATVLEELVEVVEHTERLRVVATSRNPLPALTGVEARLRVPVREITESDLSFTEQETAELLEMRRPDLEGEERRLLLAEVHRESRGWPIASHALIVERDGEGDPHRPATHGAFVRSYVRRLIDRCPVEFREALLATSLLEETSPELLAAMLGGEVAEAQRFFDDFQEASLSHWADENGIRWYRHHHLIRDGLRDHAEDMLGTARWKELYRRAAEALVEIRPREAAQASLRGEAWDVLNDLLLEDPVRLVTRNSFLKRGDVRLRDIPSSVRSAYPVLAAFALFDEYASPAGRVLQVLNGLRLLGGPGLSSASQQPGLPGAVASTLRMVAARLSGNEKLSLQMARRSEEMLVSLTPEETRRLARSLATAYTQRAITYTHANRFDDAEQTLSVLDPHAPDTRRMEVSDYHWAHRASLIAFFLAWQGRMSEAADAVGRCEEIGVPIGWRSAYVGTGYRVASALLALDGVRDASAAESVAMLDAALGHIRALDATADTTEHWPYLLEIEATILALRHDARSALVWLTEQLRRRQKRFGQPTTPKRSLQALHARLLWQVGHAAPKRPGGYGGGLGTAYAALSRGESGRARTVLKGLLTEPALASHPRRHAETLLLDAAVSLEVDDTDGARTSARLAVLVLEENALTLPYRALSQQMLGRLSELAPGIRPELGHESSAGAPAASALTSGEVRALAAVAEHSTVPEAAGALFLSPNTVKSQLRSAYRKLGVRQRDDALRIAHETGLLRGVLSSREGEHADE